MYQTVKEYIKTNHMIEKGDSVIVGVSGGADSLCLLYLLLEYQKEISFSLHVVHVHHGIRGEEADRDQAFVEQICREEKLPYTVRHYKVRELAKKWSLSEEEAGRKVRYECFRQYKEEVLANKIAVAHTMSDQAETILHHMFRGSGLKGMTGIQPVREDIIRPLLCCNRKEIEQYLMARRKTYCNDSTNQETNYTRNKIRLQILPQIEREINAGAQKHIVNMGEQLSEIEAYLEKVTEEKAEKLEHWNDGICEWKQAEFNREDKVIQTRLIRRVCKRQAGNLKDITRVHIEMILQLFEKTVGAKCHLPYELCAWRTYQGVCIATEQKLQEMTGGGQQTKQLESVELEFPLADEEKELSFLFDGKKVNVRIKREEKAKKNIKIEEKIYTKWLNYDRIKSNLLLRTRKPGDYLVINSSGGRKKLKDYFIDEKIPQHKRDKVLLLADGSQIVWVVGWRISEAYKICEDTRQILKIEIEFQNEWL